MRPLRSSVNPSLFGYGDHAALGFIRGQVLWVARAIARAGLFCEFVFIRREGSRSLVIVNIISLVSFVSHFPSGKIKGGFWKVAREFLGKVARSPEPSGTSFSSHFPLGRD